MYGGVSARKDCAEQRRRAFFAPELLAIAIKQNGTIVAPTGAVCWREGVPEDSEETKR